MKTSLIDTKSLLAKLMATENLRIEQKRCDTPYFNVKERVLTLPILSKDVQAHTYDLFMGHEVGHALFTPLEGIEKALKIKDIPKELFKGILNVVEDSRIERKIKYKYPGLRHSFIKAYKDLHVQDFFGVKDKDLDECNLVDRINLHQKVGVGLNINFTEAERDLLNDVENTETYDDVIEVSVKIWEHIKEKVEEEAKSQEATPQKLKIKVKNSESEESDLEESDLTEKFDGEVEIEFDGEPKPSGKPSNGEGEEEQTTPTKGEGEISDIPSSGSKEFEEGTLGSAIQKALEEQARAYTDENYKEQENRLFDANARDFVYVNVPKFGPDCVTDYKNYLRAYRALNPNMVDPKQFKKIKTENNKVVSYLVKEFELRKNADQQKRASISKTGELNMSKIYSYNFNDDIFKRMTTLPQGKSHGLVLFLDWSGSMTNHMVNTVNQLISIVLFCKKVNIPYEVYAFSDHATTEFTKYAESGKQGDMKMNPFCLMNILSSRMSASDFTYAASALVYQGQSSSRSLHWFQMAGTPLNEAIVAAMDIVPRFQKDNRLQIVNTIFLTDGESNSTAHYIEGHTFKSFYGNNVILRDPITRSEERIEPSSNIGIDVTKSLVSLLRKRTQSHVVGFYLVSTREFNSTSVRWYDNINKAVGAVESFKKNRFVILDNSGFDEYYFLRSNRDEAGDVDFEVDAGITKRGLVSAFTKHAGSKLSSRIVLTRFIKMIS